jgi:hypothetical protein
MDLINQWEKNHHDTDCKIRDYWAKREKDLGRPLQDDEKYGVFGITRIYEIVHSSVGTILDVRCAIDGCNGHFEDVTDLYNNW